MVCYLARRSDSGPPTVTVTLQLKVVYRITPERTQPNVREAPGDCRVFRPLAASRRLWLSLYHATRGLSLPQYLGYIPFGNGFGFGHAGVDFFFVLSGFIIMHAHATDIGKPERLSRYLWRRVTRIYPYLLGRYTNSGDPGGFFSADFAIRLAPTHIIHSLLLLPETTEPLVASAGPYDPRCFSTWCLPWPFSTGACASRLSLLR